jgi:hypothetical protein
MLIEGYVSCTCGTLSSFLHVTISKTHYKPNVQNNASTRHQNIMLVTTLFWIVPNQLTNSMEQNPSWEENSSSPTQKTSSILWNPWVQYCVQKGLPLVPTLSHICPVHTLIIFLHKIHFNISTGEHTQWQSSPRQHVFFTDSSTAPSTIKSCFTSSQIILKEITQYQRGTQRIWGAHMNGQEGSCLLGYNAAQLAENQLTFQRSMSPPSSASKTKPITKPVWSREHTELLTLWALAISMYKVLQCLDIFNIFS